MTCKESIDWLNSLIKTLGQAQYQSLWDFAQPLTEIKEMLESGNVIELPCEVGDKVFILMANRYEQRILEDTVNSFRIFTANTLEIVQMRTLLYDISCSTDAVGKTVFLTKAEAEAKLKELNENAE